jgi:hypothetical protein
MLGNTQAVLTGVQREEGASGLSFLTIILDCANNYGDGLFLAMRSLEFTLAGSPIALVAADFTTAGPEFNINSKVDFLFDTSLSKTGGTSGTAVIATIGVTTDTRWIMRLDIDSFPFDGITVNNAHGTGAAGGTNTNRGVDDIAIWITGEDEIANTTYQNPVSGGVKIFDSFLDEHVSADVIDDQILTLIL